MRARGGRLLLRIEDVDAAARARDVEDSLRDDLAWLGLTWDDETPRQSQRDYAPVARPARAVHLLLRLHPRRHVQARGRRLSGACRDRGLTTGRSASGCPTAP